MFRQLVLPGRKKGPDAASTAERGGKSKQPHRSRFAPPVKSDPGIRFAAELIDAERRFIRGSWLDLVECNNAGLRAGLSGRHFQDAAHSFLYCYLSLCAEHIRYPSVNEAVVLAERADVILPIEDVWFILDPIFNNTERVSLDLLAREVVANAAKIERYRRLRREADEILDRDPRELVCLRSITQRNRRVRAVGRVPSYV